MRQPKGLAALAMLIAMLSVLVACSDDEDTVMTSTPAATFDLTFTGTISPHVGQMLRVVVIKEDGGSGSIVKNDTQTVGSDGTFSFSWPNLLMDGESYHIDFYADHNSSGGCDVPPTDHSWRESLGAATANVTRDFQHNLNFTDVCTTFTFDLMFTGTIAPHVGKTLNAALVEIDGATIMKMSTTVASDGSFSLNFVDMLEDGKSYQLDFYADNNSSGTCDAPPTDHAWRKTLGLIRDDTAFDFQHTVNFTDVCASFI